MQIPRQAFPNGHKKFLTKGALDKLNAGRADSAGVPGGHLDPIESPWLTETQRSRHAQRQQQQQPGHAPTPHPYRWARRPVPELAGESLRRQGSGQRAPPQDSYLLTPGRAEPIFDSYLLTPGGAGRGRGRGGAGLSVSEWARGSLVAGGGPAAADRLTETHEAGAEVGMLFGAYRTRPEAAVQPPPPTASASSAADDSTREPDNAAASSGAPTWDVRSTEIPEVPTLLGDTDGGRIETLRLRALADGASGTGARHAIDLWQGDTITLEVSGRGPMNGRTVSLLVEDVIYGDKAYINMLVDGGTALSGGGRSRSRSSAFVRVSERSVW